MSSGTWSARGCCHRRGSAAAAAASMDATSPGHAEARAGCYGRSTEELDGGDVVGGDELDAVFGAVGLGFGLDEDVFACWTAFCAFGHERYP